MSKTKIYRNLLNFSLVGLCFLFSFWIHASFREPTAPSNSNPSTAQSYVVKENLPAHDVFKGSLLLTSTQVDRKELIQYFKTELLQDLDRFSETLTQNSEHKIPTNLYIWRIQLDDVADSSQKSWVVERKSLFFKKIHLKPNQKYSIDSLRKIIFKELIHSFLIKSLLDHYRVGSEYIRSVDIIMDGKVARGKLIATPEQVQWAKQKLDQLEPILDETSRVLSAYLLTWDARYSNVQQNLKGDFISNDFTLLSQCWNDLKEAHQKDQWVTRLFQSFADEIDHINDQSNQFLNLNSEMNEIYKRIAKKMGKTCGFAPISKNEFCLRDQSRDNFYMIQNQESFIDFNNEGGLFNQGVCWWHSRLTRSANYLTVYRPDLPKPQDEDEVYDLLDRLHNLKQVVEIPGYENFETFTREWKNVVTDYLDQWQIKNGLKGAWIRGVSGSTDPNPTYMAELMKTLYQKVAVQKRVTYLKLQYPGITAHAWLVVDIKKLTDGYLLYVIDSNYRRVITHRYYQGDGDVRPLREKGVRFVPYIEQEEDFQKMNKAIKAYCSLN